MTEKTKDIVNWESQLAAEAQAAAANERPPISSITLKSGIMKYMGEKVPGNNLDVVIVADTEEHLLYTTAYDADNISPPTCFAQGMSGEDLVPHETVPDKPAATCDECHFFAWGSDPKGGRGKACKEVRKLAIIPASALSNPSTIADAEIAVLRIPVTSVKHLAKYIISCAAKGRPLWSMVTNISVEPDDRTQFKVNFAPKEAIQASECFGPLNELRDLAVKILLTPYDLTQPEPKKGAGKKEKF